ncbi:MAG: PKD domain-containing protein [Ignavibacteria bacterium]|jgi:hypothetical protein
MKRIKQSVCAHLLFFFLCNFTNAQQVNISRIDMMPDFPEPYLMRDWEEVTKGYDSLVFNTELTGEYLPLLFFRNNTVNYPGDISFGLHTVVGTTSPSSGEAINVIPAVIGASLIGIDKSNQNGYNWVKMCREYFNNRPEENVYLNHPSAESGDDWWYATMPNVFFYQLYDLYPQTEDFDYQLRSVADQWLEAVENMGGSSTPWDTPNMDYRGWYLSTMSPYTSGVKEPEAAGAIAWLLYNAYKETGEKKYRVGAEWALEFLNDYSSNPSYELQLPYGVYIAAKMNAELGTGYDIEKMLNWCFNVGPLRDWGAVIGNWGGLDVSGLIGEVNGNNDYPFLMNTFEHVGALVPLVRYDDRFANAIGKWVLNAANAARLFYTNYLPDNYQDSEEWSHQYDPNSYIGHEAIRQLRYGATPYATGDAIDGGWGETNLVLYGSSHVGIFGSIIDTTNIEGILKLDLLKTDFFKDTAFETYLIYNPYDENKTVTFDIGWQFVDIYETTSNAFLLNGVSGNIEIDIPSKTAYVAVFVPHGGAVEYESGKLLVDNVVVDYSSEQTPANYSPRIKSLSTVPTSVLRGDSISVYCTAVDKDNDGLVYTWSASNGEITGSGSRVTWIAPEDTGKVDIRVEVNDGNDGSSIETLEIDVVEQFNAAPVINEISTEQRKVDLGAETDIECSASDEDDDPLEYTWSSESGQISGSGSKIKWTAPNQSGNYFVVCTVTDGNGGVAADSISISVRDLSIVQTGVLICYLPFNGAAIDESGNNNSVTVSGALLTADRFNAADNAYIFDGSNDNIKITNSSLLNFTNAVTINFWINIDKLYDREQYTLSHGNWEQRWKISISNNRIRWTIKTDAGITDLDSETMITTNNWYNVTALYSGSDIELYINGKLDAFANWSGNLSTTDLDLTIGQSVPGDNNYNFDGSLDEIRIYDYALPLNQIEQFYDITTSVEDDHSNILPTETVLYQNYPNPFNPITTISFTTSPSLPPLTKGRAGVGLVSLAVFDILGNKISTLINNKYIPAGRYEIEFDASALASGVYFYQLRVGDVIQSKKMLVIK